MKNKLAYLFVLLISFSSSQKLVANDLTIAQKFAPMVYFHPSELYFPSSVEFAMKHMSLMRETAERKVKSFGPLDITKKKREAEIVKESGVTAADLSGKDDKHFLQFRGSKSEKRTYYKGESFGSIATAPVYARIHKVDGNNYAIMYAFFYPYNGPLSVASIGGRGALGYHEGDWEHIEVFIQKVGDEWKLVSVHFARHGREAGELLDAGQFKTYNGTQPIVLSAMYGHGSYPEHVSGLTKHVDRVQKGNRSWNTSRNVILINSSTPWNNSKVRWGATQSLTNSSPQSPLQQSWWREIENYKPKALITSDISRASEIYRVKKIKVIGGKKQLFSKDISSQYKKICFEIVKPGSKTPEKNISFNIMERKRIGNNKLIYRNPAGGKCHLVKTPSMKGYYVDFTGGNDRNATYDLVLKGL